MIPLRDANPSSRTPWVTFLIIGLNILAFLYEVALPGPGAGAARCPRGGGAGGGAGLPRRPGHHFRRRLPAAFFEHVPARRLAAFDREHVVPVDFRRQHRRPAGAPALPRVLPDWRPGGGAGAHAL